MIILRLFPRLLTNGVAAMDKLSLDKAAAENLSQKERNKYVSDVRDRQMTLAFDFREYMTKGQTYHSPNAYRSTFYTEVTNAAEEVNSLSFLVFVRMTVFLQFVRKCQPVADEKEPEHGRFVSGGRGLREAGEALCRFIDEHQLTDSKNGPRVPLVVLAFDEADTLTDNPPGQNDWNLFSELRRVLRQIQHLQIFSLFLSTAGRFDKFSPDIHSDPSARAREPAHRPLDPISEISFDDIAYPALEDTVTIDNVVEIDWISHLGRPLYVHPSYPFRELLSYHLE